MMTKKLAINDSTVYSSIERETQRQLRGIELIASENYVSEAVLEAMGSILTNKYSEGYAGVRYYAGNKFIDEIESLAVNRAKQLFGAEHVNVQPYSGSPANLAVYLATLSPGDTVLGMDLAAGGHLTHGFKVSVTGKWFNAYAYGVNSAGYIDYEQVRNIALQCRPKLIWAGYTAYSRLIDWGRFRSIADEIGAVLAVDMSHIAGLVAAGILESPVSYADIVTTTTHKTLRGPRAGMILCKQEWAEKIDKAVFPGIQGGPHNHNTAAIAVALGEALQPEFKQYAQQVINNAKALAVELQKKDFLVVSGGTDNHMMLLDLQKNKVTGKQFEKALEQANITVNKNMIPNDPRKPWDPSGVRVGTPAITTRGLKEEEMGTIAAFMARVRDNYEDESQLSEIGHEVTEFITPFPIPGISE